MRALNPLKARGSKSLAALLAALFMMAALAGCFGDSGEEEEDDSDPGDDGGLPVDDDDGGGGGGGDPPLNVFMVKAGLVADQQAGWAGENWTFDASNSTVVSGEGNITSWTFDFGDGSDPVVVEDEDDLPVEHMFSEGGIYVVNLTVEGESLDGETANDTMGVPVFVSERLSVEGEAADQIFLVDSGDEWNDTYPLRFGAVGFNVTLEVEDDAAIGSSGGTVSFTLPGEDEPLAQTDLEEGEVRLGSFFDLETLELGDCELKVSLDEGDVAFNGTLEIYYGIDPDAVE